MSYFSTPAVCSATMRRLATNMDGGTQPQAHGSQVDVIALDVASDQYASIDLDKIGMSMADLEV